MTKRAWLWAVVSLVPAIAQAATPSGWYGDNEKRLREFLGEKISGRRVAVFDWDNTIIKNDIGDATVFYFVARGLIKNPGDWKKTSPHLSDAALKALDQGCPLAKAGSLLPTHKLTACADAVLAVYYDGKLADGASAWREGYNADALEPGYAWGVQLMAGYTPGEIRKMVEKVIHESLKRPVGATQKIGSREVDAYLRIYPQMRQLIRDLQNSGYDVWVSSASSQNLVEMFALQVGIKADHVIGVRPVLDPQGKTTFAFQGCGTYPDGTFDLINYRQGKRCWINKIIFGVTDPKAQLEQSSPTQFAAGDSDTDAFFVKDAQALRLVINRNKNELMCNAYENKDGHWLINPMFIKPKAAKDKKYDCSKYGIKEQADSVF